MVVSSSGCEIGLGSRPHSWWVPKQLIKENKMNQMGLLLKHCFGMQMKQKTCWTRLLLRMNHGSIVTILNQNILQCIAMESSLFTLSQGLHSFTTSSLCYVYSLEILKKFSWPVSRRKVIMCILYCTVMLYSCIRRKCLENTPSW